VSRLEASKTSHWDLLGLREDFIEGDRDDPIIWSVRRYFMLFIKRNQVQVPFMQQGFQVDRTMQLSTAIHLAHIMSHPLKIDFVSDISCPWCAIGLSALEQALGRLQNEVAAELHFQPFELNPQMPAGGQDIGEHLAQKYGSTPDQQAQA